MQYRWMVVKNVLSFSLGDLYGSIDEILIILASIMIAYYSRKIYYLIKIRGDKKKDKVICGIENNIIYDKNF